MVQEVRKIVFSQDELISAFECYRRLTPEFLPGERVVYCKPIDETTVQVTVEAEVDGSTQLQEHTVKGVEVLKPLIRFCIQHRIMLPKEGRKTVTMFKGQLVICVSLCVDIDLADSVMPPQGDHASLSGSNEADDTVVAVSA